MGIPGLSARQPLYYGDSDAPLPEWHHGSYYRMKKKGLFIQRVILCLGGAVMHSSWASRTFGMIVSDIPE